MVEVTEVNFDSVLSDFKHLVEKCSFFSVDCEFTALPPQFSTHTGLLETPEEKYCRFRKHIGQCLVVQIGITPFRYYRDLNHYKAFPYNFNVFPKPFGSFDTFTLCSSSTILFLCNSKFNFNKVFYDGISYMNKSRRKEVLNELKNGTLLNSVEKNMGYDQIDKIVNICDRIRNWLSSSQESFYELPTMKYYPAFNYALREEIHKISPHIWTKRKNQQMVVIKVSPEERIKLENDDASAESATNFIESLKEFSKVFEILAASKKPMVGHNLFLDLLAMYHQFYEDLPDSYNKFKKNLNVLFPHIYDTKLIATELLSLKNQGDKITTLTDVFRSYQNNGTIIYFPNIIMDSKEAYNNFEAQNSHDAGWDSYMTGFIFLKMADEFVRIKQNDKGWMQILSTELFNYIKVWENQIKVARCQVTYLNFAGDDPVSRRPPTLHVSHIKKQCLRMVELDSAFKKYEPIYKRQLDLHSALIATPNFKCFKKILVDFSGSNEFRVEKYSIIKHNRGVQACLVAGIFVPVLVTIWIGLLK